jgi:hypothetical protein
MKSRHFTIFLPKQLFRHGFYGMIFFHRTWFRVNDSLRPHFKLGFVAATSMLCMTRLKMLIGRDATYFCFCTNGSDSSLQVLQMLVVTCSSQFRMVMPSS